MQDLASISPKAKGRPDWVRRYVYGGLTLAFLHVVVSLVLVIGSFSESESDNPTPEPDILVIWESPMAQVREVAQFPRFARFLNDPFIGEMINALLWGIAAVGIWHAISAASSAIRRQLERKSE